ncbi:MAG: hypothetical protein EP298_01540 [Gammaproteobacteria bacterium]|nr:MAG: hypothetical protein EP298_01540 [Gammaproteobacteria bacterium]UTW43889.1 hypothetical protein KFE69_07315 [bacterium SCSIO 12844]
MTHNELILTFIDVFNEIKSLKQFNQEKHYRQYSESVNNVFLDYERDKLLQLSPRSLSYNIELFGGGFCEEHVKVLAYKLRCKLNGKVEYKIRLMVADVDHAYLYIHAKVDSNKHVYFRLDNWDKDFKELSTDEYYSSVDTEWGKHKVRGTWTNHHKLTLSQDEAKIITQKIHKNDCQYEGDLPDDVYTREPHHIDVIKKLENSLSETRKRKESSVENLDLGHPQTRRRQYIDPAPIFCEHPQTSENEVTTTPDH